MDSLWIIRHNTISTEKINHKSALKYPTHVDAYLADQLEHGAMLSPYKEPSIKDLHISPFQAVDKSSSDKRRVIIYISWPKG